MAAKNLPARAQSRAVATVSDADWNAEAKAAAAKHKAAVADLGLAAFLSFRGGVISYQQAPVPGNRLPAVILDFRRVNAYYGNKDFDPDNPSSPVCFAIGEDPQTMAPPDDVVKKQSEDGCAFCPQNKFGSAKTGRGKACKNGIRFALIHADSLKSPEAMESANIVLANVPPTSLPSFANYVKGLDTNLGRQPFQVTTEIGITPDPKTQFKVTFELIDEIKDKRVRGPLLAKLREAVEPLEAGFSAPSNDDDDEATAKRGVKRSAKPQHGAKKSADSSPGAFTRGAAKKTKPAPAPATKSGRAKF